MTAAPDYVDPESPVRAISRGRVFLVHAIIAVILLGHGYDIARQQEHWPFSNYPMWARLSKDWHVSGVVPVGLTTDPARPEVELSDPSYFAPMPLHYQRLTFGGLRKNTARRDKVLADYLHRYEQLRRAGRHDGPPLVGLRLYDRYWKMDTRASNAATPDRTTLVYEYRPTTGLNSKSATSLPATTLLPTTAPGTTLPATREAAAGAH